MLFSGLLVTALSTLFLSAQPCASEAVLPSKDPFWKPPKNLSDYKPGDIIRHRKPPSELGIYGRPLKIASAWQILYRSNGVNDEPLATVVTVLVPENADFNKLLTYQSEIDAPYEGCTPSITLQRQFENVNNIASQYSEFWLASALQRGWVVAVPDYQGPDAIFGVGQIAGKLVLDAVRAVRRSKKITGVKPKAKHALWGYSGGTIATDFAAELQPKYAPELDFVGVAMGGLPVDLEHLIMDNNKRVGAGFILAGVLGVSKAFPEVKKIVDQQLIPGKAKMVRQVLKQCVVPTVIQHAGRDMFKFFKDGKAVFKRPRVRKILGSLKMGNTGVPKAPLYIYMAKNDELLSFDDTQALVNKYCKKGVTVEFVREASGGHIVVALVGAPSAMAWLVDRFDGKPIKEKCSQKTYVSSVYEPQAAKILANIIRDVTSALFGKKLGPDGGS